jgi:hypothetical protein
MMTLRDRPAATLAAVALGAALLSSSSSVARTASFDGNWTVLVITETGSCDRAYRYGVNVENGAVHYRGEAGVAVSGRVENDGRVTVSIGRGEQRAQGTGRLSGESGSGTWSGTSSASQCRGRWEAERR